MNSIVRPEAAPQAFQDGWFATGDIGYLDNDDYFFTKQLPHTSSGKLVRHDLPDLPHTLHE